MIAALDSNILVYAADLDETVKHPLSLQIIERGLVANAIFPAQVLGEFLSVARRRRPNQFRAAVKLVEAWRLVGNIVVTSPDDLIAAARLVERHKFQFWDAVIWSVAAAAGARWFLSEDLQDGFSLDGLTVLNPLLPANAAMLDDILPALP